MPYVLPCLVDASRIVHQNAASETSNAVCAPTNASHLVVYLSMCVPFIHLLAQRLRV